MKEELDTVLIGVLVAFQYGWFGPVRPGALISLCHPSYQVTLMNALSTIAAVKCAI
jgi:hypothetical protein